VIHGPSLLHSTGDGRIVRRDYECRIRALEPLEQQVEKMCGSMMIELARRLVGENQRWPGYEAARHSSALRLSA
jgi:hypothetical protein